MKKEVMILTGAGRDRNGDSAVWDMGKRSLSETEPGEYRGCLPYIE